MVKELKRSEYKPRMAVLVGAGPGQRAAASWDAVPCGRSCPLLCVHATSLVIRLSLWLQGPTVLAVHSSTPPDFPWRVALLHLMTTLPPAQGSRKHYCINMHATKQTSIDEACEELLKESQVGAGPGFSCLACYWWPLVFLLSDLSQHSQSGSLTLQAACVGGKHAAGWGRQVLPIGQLAGSSRIPRGPEHAYCTPADSSRLASPLAHPLQCQYFKNVHSFATSGYQYRLHDIEDLKGFGRSHKACPYFTARKWADVSGSIGQRVPRSRKGATAAASPRR